MQLAPRLVRHGLAAILFVAVSASVTGTPAKAQELTTNEALARLFEEGLRPDWFAEAFLGGLPFPFIEQAIGILFDEGGEFVEVVGDGNELTIRMTGADIPTTVMLNAAGEIVYLTFGTPMPTLAALQVFIDEMVALSGEVSVLIATEGEFVAGHQPDLPLGVASAFTLLVLSALLDEIDAGTIAWDDVILLEEAHRSFPEGVVGNWPVGSPITVSTLANLMVADRDSTAADILIDLVGRERLEAMSPRNTPFLTTGEFFKLKARQNHDLRMRWIAADETERRELLAELAEAPLPRPRGDYETVVGIEYYFDAFELCALLDRTFDATAVGRASGPVYAADWRRVAHADGTEQGGYVNYSSMVIGEDGLRRCVVVTWNAVGDDYRLNDLSLPYSRLLSTLADMARVPN